jgi:hypothetical protein
MNQEKPQMSEDFGDFFDSGPSVPSVSWKTARRGESIEGVLVKPHETRQQTSMEDNTPLFWNDGKPRTQAVLTIQTQYKNNEFTSENFQTRAEGDPEFKDDGVRALFVSGGSMPKALKAAMRAARAQKPEVGATIKVTLKARTQVAGKTYSTNEFDVTYQSPTEASRKVVEAWEKENAPVGDSAGADDSPWGTPPSGGGSFSDAPAF